MITTPGGVKVSRILESVLDGVIGLQSRSKRRGEEKSQPLSEI